MDKKRERQYLQIPEQTLSTLSFCEPTARELNAWVSSLPMANIGETARQLYHAIIEFNQLRLTEQSRFDLLELVRNPIHYICNALNRRYLTQSVVLDDSQRKIANLAQALQTHLAIGYKIIVVSKLKEPNTKSKELIARSVHRCMSDLAPNILRSYQLYLKSPPGIWQEIHSLYQICLAQNLTSYRLVDEQSNSEDPLSVSNLYARILLLGSCQPNQLHHMALSEIYQALEKWSSKVSIDDVADQQSTLIINPEIDSGPIYRHLMKPQSYSDYMGLNTSSLVRALHQSLIPQQEGVVSSNGIDIPMGISSTLVHHLVQSWGGMKQRAFSRSMTSGEVDVAVGLSAVHFRLSNGVGFYRQLYSVQDNSSTSSNPFMGAAVAQFDSQDTQATRYKSDVWEKSFDAGTNIIPGGIDIEQEDDFDRQKSEGESYPEYLADLVNTSPRGYCLGWLGNLAKNIQTGEIVAIRESGSNRWNLGIIRWIRQGVQEGAQIGIELVAPNSEPCAVRLLNKTGTHGDYMRGLIVPEIKSIAQPGTILVPRVPFQVGHKVGVNKKGAESRFQLIKKIQGTTTLNQFQIRSLDAQDEKPKTKERVADEGFESLWRQL